MSTSPARRVTDDLRYLMARTAGPQPRPLRVVSSFDLPPAGMLTGDEPTVVVAYETRELHPVHVRHPMAVYELRDGLYSVMRNGSDWGKPFETTDLDLAREVCDRWAVEFREKT